MSQPKILVDIIGRQLKPGGFKRKADTWHLASGDTILVLNLQKSNYGQQYYINVAAWLNALGDANAPKEHQCHVRCRWESLIPDVDEKYLEKLLDLEDTSISKDERSAEISRLLRTFILPFFAQIASLSGLRTAYHSKFWPASCLVHRSAQDLLLSDTP